ncbi:MAG: GatB/YqeY domain-containing protein [Verrucomicrobiales bacterium]
MSTINERISEDLKTAMRAKNQMALNVLRSLKSALKYAAIEKFGAEGELSETDAVSVVRKEIKKRQDSIEQFEKAARQELADNEKAEIALLQGFLPPALSETEIEALITQAITETGATSKAHMGAVMKLVQERAAGRAEGRVLSQAVMKKLG